MVEICFPNGAFFLHIGNPTNTGQLKLIYRAHMMHPNTCPTAPDLPRLCTTCCCSLFDGADSGTDDDHDDSLCDIVLESCEDLDDVPYPLVGDFMVRPLSRVVAGRHKWLLIGNSHEQSLVLWRRYCGSVGTVHTRFAVVVLSFGELYHAFVVRCVTRDFLQAHNTRAALPTSCPARLVIVVSLSSLIERIAVLH